MGDAHTHWWMFMFREPNLVYFTQLPCCGDTDVAHMEPITEAVTRIVTDNREAFGTVASGQFKPQEIPDRIEVPEGLRNRLCSPEEVRSFFDSGGLLQ